ncbi:hypothetical protein FRACYDRAFT_257814, partial [Fragilariopsis cylindrus CCMP1102]
MTMGFDGGSDPPAGIARDADDTVEVEMDLEETTDPAVGRSGENSGRSSLQTEAAKTAGKATNGMQKIDEENSNDDETFDDYSSGNGRRSTMLRADEAPPNHVETGEIRCSYTKEMQDSKDYELKEQTRSRYK